MNYQNYYPKDPYIMSYCIKNDLFSSNYNNALNILWTLNIFTDALSPANWI